MTTATATQTGIVRFWLDRVEDESGVSGTGAVAFGVVLPSGRCVLEWRAGEHGVRSIGVYESIREVEIIHGHQGRTVVRYED